MQPYAIILNKQEVEFIQQVLSGGPFNQVAPLLQKIGAQMNEQDAERAVPNAAQVVDPIPGTQRTQRRRAKR